MNAPPGTRRFLTATLVVALLAAASVVLLVGPYLDPVRAPRNVVLLSELAAAPAPAAGTVMQIVAHQDDDLFFMNPDVGQAIEAGAGSVSVYLAAGEADGRNGPGSRRDFDAYTAARNNGARAAYAHMATGDRASPWIRQSVRLPGGAVAEVDSLAAVPRVRLVFLNTRKEKKAAGRKGRLRTLWDGKTERLGTLVPTDSRAGGPYTYTRSSLIASLTELLHTFRPTAVRTLDPDPDKQVHDADHPRHSDHGDRSDHQDHTAAALFSWEALRGYPGPGDGRHATVTAYRGYYNERWPANLGPEALAAKRAPLDVYGWGGPGRGRFCGERAGCGDRKVGDRGMDGPWPRSTTYRHPDSSGPWLSRGPDGRLAAWAVLDQGVGRWLETAPGSGMWTGPEVFPGPGGGPLAGALAAVRTPDGRGHLFALRISPGPGPAGQRRDLVTATEERPGGPLGPWTSLGNPAASGRDAVRGLGTPAAVVGGDGRLHVFVRDHGKGVSTRVRTANGQGPGGGWGRWTALGGGPVVEGLAAVAGPGGRVQVFGTGHDAVLRWAEQPGGQVRPGPALPAGRPVGPPAAVLGADGRLTVLHHEAGTGSVLAIAERAPGGGWSAPVRLPDSAGYGPVAAVPDRPGTGAGRSGLPDGLAVALRTERGSVRCGADVLPGPVVRGPGIAVDARGRVVTAAIGLDGRLRMMRSVPE
ncbi:PIG-L family deacetylase [Yinghuangia soli]|uniref:PIG-L family deacetylase n=1 Tax=Yinghuangia soli TaxID=2908204 RepID=A0AA41PX51_9ACTN|nr:PIG-L family deacetylase [Yinghuangia soli]MCF2526821.1 PIG-L family deacetylase [Yinghuangia soli]